MLAAIIAALAAVVLLSAVIAIVFFVRNRSRAPHVSSNPKTDVHAIDTVVSADSSQEAGGKQPTTPRPGSANLTDALRSRFAVLGGFTAVVFGALFARVGNMQIALSDEYLSQAEENQYTTVSTPAPRGIIYDRDGIELVRNRTSLTVLADAEVAEDRTVVQRLSALLGVPHNIVKHRIEDATSGAQSQRVVASDAALRSVAFIVEHADAFPGVTTQSRTEREYPWGALAAHLLGYTGTVTEEGLANIADGREIEMGDTVGQSGIESAYDQILAGTHGQRVVIADADGTVQRVVSETRATKGNDIYLTISGPVQAKADSLLANLVAPVNGVIGTGSGDSASLVVMDVTDGSILAMASYPTFAPEAFVGGISTEIWELYSSEEAYNPLLNRVISGLYPAASTFKAFTGLAGLAYGFADSSRTWNCTGSWDYWETGSAQMCWLQSGHGYLDFRSGIVQSCDIVFYEIAKDFFEAAQNGELSMTAMQEYIEKFGFGQTTGLDIGGEQAGRVPTPEWKAEYWKDYPEDATWLGGDMTNLVIGQGDVLVTPLQMAVAYGGVTTGKLMRPHLLKEVRNSEGETVATYEPEVISELDVPEENLVIVRDALRGVATENSTISALCSEYGISVAGKTGTAENSGEADSAWFVCYAPYDDPKYVVACQVDHGGSGATVAAPVGVEMMATVLSYAEGELDESSMSVIAASTGKSIALQNTSSARTD